MEQRKLKRSFRVTPFSWLMIFLCLLLLLGLAIYLYALCNPVVPLYRI